MSQRAAANGTLALAASTTSRAGFMAFFPILLLVILIQNHLSRGLTMGAVKG
jgi:multiple sugar transport system permease protein